ncbi:cell cycle control protein 50C-like isoform X3 [Myxocyprinus asiaticus]|uniref:cell cycle control protein 50C-like isoform X3 n=1 Tax=Myxocyprinus asiaticus TaxID=70543 RepID=UPI00222330C8|nr:cell cycle control protein 50C-like isoform X3 [Myxocyprinus asiaticus]
MIDCLYLIQEILLLQYPVIIHTLSLRGSSHTLQQGSKNEESLSSDGKICLGRFNSQSYRWTTQMDRALSALRCGRMSGMPRPTGDVFFYYGLRNFHQNLRRYMDSRDDAQMVGRKTNLKTPSSYCAPFDYDAHKVPIAPCGAVANSMFNDSFIVMHYPKDGPAVQVPLFRKGIAWYTDKNVKFRNPPTNETFTLHQAFEGTTLPFFWQHPVYELDTKDHNNNGFINDDLIVWMREAAFPNFKKLYGVLNRAQEPFADGLPYGNYTISISYNFPVEPFRGQKEVVISTVTWFGGQNHFLPIAYLVTSGLILVAAIGLTTVYVKVGKKGKNMEE